ncbi:MAG: M90 family metallopeptidase [Snowella sp.]|nr:M90 family metallopeptidase [Snowella sp.]
MLPTLFVLILLTLVIAYIWGQPFLVQLKHAQIQQKPFPEAWLNILETELPLYQHLPEPIQQRLKPRIQIFLAHKQFIGCNGLKITDKIRLIIAAYACLLALNLKENYYPKLQTILVYPTIFQRKQVTAVDEYIVEEQQTALSGESWGKEGQVVLSWQIIEQDLDNWQDGHNVIFHEFAHQLDQQEGPANGVPPLPKHSDYQQWANVFTEEYQQLLSQLANHLPTVIDPYGATHPAEFFAVVTELFLERASVLKQFHPQLFQLLKNYYQFDPCLWLNTTNS